MVVTLRHAPAHFQQHCRRDGDAFKEIEMSAEMLIIWLVVGAVAGWLAGMIVKGGGFGLIGDIVVGIIGAFVGGWLFGQMGVSAGAGLVGAIVTATIGAVALLAVLRMVRAA
jgi:uncharacterized membrane protein YeaQ/YmgE (transglycosylase-associated protein family)